MSLLSGIRNVVKNPYYILTILNKRRLLKWMPDKMFVKLNYRRKMRRRLDLENPRLFSEKLQWLKLYDRKPEYTRLVDKYEARGYIAGQIGEEYLIPLLGVWNKVEDIDFSTLPAQFVLKCTHDSGGLVICRDRNAFDAEAAKKTLRWHAKRNYYSGSREYPYKNVKPRIICEKYMTDESGYELKDYKVFCFNGEPMIVQVDYDRFTEHKRNMYDIEWSLLPVKFRYPIKSGVTTMKPERLDKMTEISRKLSIRHAFVRVDFYVINNAIYAGEITFFPESGYTTFDPPAYDRIFGDFLLLPDKKYDGR